MTLPEEFSVKVRRIQNDVERITGRSIVHGVAITVSASGAILTLDIPHSAQQLDPGTLADAVAAAHSRAYADATEQARDIRAELADDPRIRQVTQVLDTPVAASAAARKRDAEAQQHESDDEYFRNFRVLR
ncbi:MAG: YbaB/EbfC family nucleoid-associated protein [Rhodococcus sp. (in: high G+C Gram-positive bacteria)]|uniref:YbaB/EbfC family nucleoid-associated protein n=1 Tax=Rhodococcus sp. TaxID=1831 RepID=UPI003BB79079